ncbi:ankyrin repeat-containing domain protein [Colletotrichum godetiae]|uniref:Ankyrin repeat-containing domain protein n=1 Tax=Colletotrichum godetiae TaxID=1209918 RepID=A0AAJ0AA97_9PEZI|nr:ankyrin repeat-containing domain protein [Colletotrichum godetiae]KAK1658814.1 ankyrin repeat-containing domain protein [Colletotrichum godetiae]
MSSDHAYHQRNSTGRPPAVAHEYAQEKRAWSVSSEEEIHYGLAKRARTAGSLYTPNNAGPFLVKLSHEAYTVGWVCALHLEMAAAQAMLDYRHQPLDMNPNDSNVYTFGGIGPHNIVIACLPSGQYGTNSAAVVANNMRWSFPSFHIGLMVGIGGGVPGKVDIRLGDVVVSNPTADSPGVVQYDFGKAVNDGRFERIGSLNKPSLSSLAAVSKLRADHEARPSEISRILSDMARRNDYMVEYTRQFVDEDRLFEASYKHSGETCENCDRSKLVPRSLRPTNNPSIHYGIIASGNQLMKNAGTRDRLAKDLGLICFEMEAAGLMDNFPCLVIRGICDYSDSHKAKRWQKYAAATAAAYARELLLVMPPQGHSAVQTQLEVQSTATPSANRKWLLDSLKFDQIDKRHANIKANHAKTCEWLLEHPAYTTWIDRKKYSQHHGFLWIRGKPGAGKSTIMKFAFTRARRRAASIGPSISFFFNARGEGLEKSTLGMYRSLLHQLLEKIPDLQFLLDTDDDQQETAVWDLEKTKTLFRSAVRELGKRQLTCFIDALDECAESEIREMVEVFEDLGQYAVQNDIRFYVCFSSRHYPHIDIQYGQKLTLEDQTGHEKDLAEYVRSSLKAGTGPKSDEIIAEILQKASGVFMWVVLVVDILNREYLRGRLFAVKSRLKEIPSKLSELFQNILTRDQENLDDLLLCIQWVLYSSRPLKREEYYFALASGLEPDTLGEWDPDEIPCEFMDRLIVSSSKGLAETTRSDDKTVQFIHESVRDYLLKDNGLRTLWPDMAADFEAQSHNRLRDCCHEYSSQVNISGYLQDDDHLLQSSKRAVIDLKAVIERGFPFLEYATSQVLYHANAAARTDLQTDLQTEFLQSFPLKQWTQRSNIFEKHMTRRQKHDTTNLLYIVAERGLSELVKTTLRHNPDAEIRGGRYGYPLLAALKGGHEDVAKLLLECIESSTQKAGSSSYSTPESENSSYVPPSINYSDKQGRTPLYFAAERGQVDIAKTLFGLGAQPDLIPKNISYSPLVRAVEKGQGVLAELILERRSAWQSRATTNANLQSSSSMDKHEDDQLALVKTAENGNIDMAKILLRNGVSVDAGSELYHAPLAAAVQRGQKPFIEFLLDEGADINRGDLLGGKKPIQVAARKSTPEFIHLLAQRGCDLEGRDACGSTPLHIACKDSKKSSVMALLEAGANPYAQDVDGNTPLLTAVQYNEPVVKDLLLHYSKLERNGKITSSHEESQEAFDSGLPNFRLMVNKIGQTPLFRPSPHHDTHVLSDLLDAGLDPSHQDNEGQNFLHRAWPTPTLGTTKNERHYLRLFLVKLGPGKKTGI